MGSPIVAEWPPYLSPADATQLAAGYGLRLTLRTLANWRSLGRLNGAPTPKFCKARMGSILYPRDEFIAWCRCELGPTVNRVAELTAA